MSDLRRKLNTAQRLLAKSEGELSVLRERKKALLTTVGLAKGRLEQKPKIDIFLEELQNEAHIRRVGDFERLLTALVYEVLPGESPVGLELDITRGQPSLDIVSRLGPNMNEDLFEDQGGALTNVVSTGLRMIAIVRSQMRRLLVLDEADCWTANERIPSFYSVFKDAAQKIGMQCIAISHHIDVSNFGEGISVATMSGHPKSESGVYIENDPKRHAWGDDEDGIRWIRLKDFQGIVDETIHLTPGVNVLVGRNNIGKSSILRALRAVFLGECRDTLIRHGRKACSVEVGFSHGFTLLWDRKIKRNPINIWKLLGPDGAVFEEDGMRYETGSRKVPDWVPELFKIGPIEGLDAHMTKQKTPVFLLDKPGSTRASVLSIGQESGHIRTMIDKHKQRCADDASTVKEGEKEVAKINERIEALEKLDLLREKLTGFEETLAEIEASSSRIDTLVEVSERLKAAREAESILQKKADAFEQLPSAEDGNEIEAQSKKLQNLSNLQNRIAKDRHDVATFAARAKVLEKLPPAPVEITGLDLRQQLEKHLENMKEIIARGKNARAVAEVLAKLPDNTPELSSNDDKIAAGRAVRSAKTRVATLTKAEEILKRLPTDPPTIKSHHEAEVAGQNLVKAKSTLRIAENAAAETDAALKQVREQMKTLVAEMGNACPACGQHISDANDLLEHQAHEGGDGHA